MRQERRCKGSASGRVPREVDDDIGAVSGCEKQRVLVHVADIEAGGIGNQVVTCWPSTTTRAGRKPPSVPISTQSGPSLLSGRREDVRIGLCALDLCRLQSDFGPPDNLTGPFNAALAVDASPSYHWKLKKRSFAAFSMRKR